MSATATAPAPSAPVFANEGVLLYNVNPWNTYGFACPNFGQQIGTLSTPIHHLVDEIGKAQLNLMLNVDAMRWQPPSLNTAVLVAQMYNRVASILALRAKSEGTRILNPGKAGQAPKVFTIHPVPYFPGPLVVNPWLTEWNELIMIALANMMQHSTNNVGLAITQQFASEMLPYFQEIAIKLGTELLTLPAGRDPSVPGFLFQIDPTGASGDFTPTTYVPSTKTVNIENISGPGPIFNLPTAQDVVELRKGIPANLILPNLVQYPVGPIPGLSAAAGNPLLSSDAILAATATGANTLGTAADTPNLAAMANLAPSAPATTQVAGSVATGTGVTPTVTAQPSLPPIPPATN